MDTLREINIGDYKDVCRLSGELGYNIDALKVKNNIKEIIASDKDCAFVAISKDEVVGWIHGFYTTRIESGPFVEIGGLVVTRNHQRKGIGKMLVQQVEIWAKEKSGTLKVRCNIKRPDAHRFYEKTGFLLVKEQKVFELIIK